MKELFQKRTGWLPLLMSSLLTSSVFFFFGPLRMYMSHITKLWFSLRDIFVPTAAMCLIAAALLFGLGMLLFKSRKLFRVYIGFLFAVGIMLFVQGCIIPDRYGVLTGSIFTRKQYIDRVITNTDIWLCAIIASFILGKILKKHFGTVVAAVSACVMLAQFIMLVGLYVKTDFGEKTDSSPYLSSKNLYSLSGEQNIIVLVADGFDQASFLKIMDEDPRRMEMFDGFTVFDNMTGEYPDAKGALPFILTGRYYENAEPYPEYIDLAWEEAADYYAALKSEGYRIGIYTQDTEAVSDGAGDMIDNLIFAEIGTSSAAALEKDLVQLTAMRFFPDALKEYVWSGRELFDDAKTTEEGQYPRYSSDIKDCRDMLVSGGLTADEKQPVYHVVHLETVLTGADAAEAEENGHGSAAMTRAEGYLSVLEEFFGRLKELGIYDRTMIVITGGHGSEEVKSNPVMLAKDFGKRDAPVISHVPVSHKNIFAAVTDAPEYEERYGKSLFGAGENDGGERRYFLYPLGGETLREDYLPDMTEYYILPDGSGPENYRLSGKIHTREGVVEKTPYAAKTGEAVAFGSGEAIAHFVSGISAVSEKYTDKNGRERSCSRALGNSGRACFDFEENAQALFCRIELCDNMPDGGQRFVVKAKDTVLFDGKVSNDMPYADFLIPEQCFDYELLMLDFEYPEERYYPSLKEDISIAFAEIFFKKAVNTDRIDLTRYGDSSENVRSGWHGQEDAWRWTEKKASLQVLLGTVDAHMSVRYWTHPGAEDTSVYLNGKRIGVLPHHEEGDGNFVSLPLPKEYRRESGADMITFITEGATSSKEYYGSEDDDRVLGIAVSEIRFTKPEYTRRIDCAAGGNSSAYLLSDWYGQEDAWRWSKERSSVQVVPGAEDTQISVRYWTHPGARDTSVYLNGERIGVLPHHKEGDKNAVSLPLPKEYRSDGGADMITFVTEGATSSKEYSGDDDERVLGIAVYEIRFTKPEYTRKIDCAAGGNSSAYLLSDWYGQEDAWRWTGERSSVQVVPGAEDTQMSVRYWTHPGARDTSIYLNGKRIGVLPHHEEGDESAVSLPLPAAYRNESGADMITFVTEGATSSKEYYGSGEDDERILGIAVSEIVFAPAD